MRILQSPNENTSAAGSPEGYKMGGTINKTAAEELYSVLSSDFCMCTARAAQQHFGRHA